MYLINVPSKSILITHQILYLLHQVELYCLEKELIDLLENIFLVLNKENVIDLKKPGHTVKQGQILTERVAVHCDHVDVPEDLEIAKAVVEHERAHVEIEGTGQLGLDGEGVQKVFGVVDGSRQSL